MPVLTAPRVLAAAQWRSWEAAHHDRVDAATSGWLARRRAGGTHPVEDFLFTYYGFRPGHLRRWHAGPGVQLAGAASEDRAGWRHHRTDGDRVGLDVASYVAARGETVRFVRDLLSATAARSAHLGCFGLHEWAMVYRMGEDEVRHAEHPLRLGREGTDAVVESMPVRCSHFDAFRFFTPPARSLNLLQPTREGQVGAEQPGCLHAGMDCYRWAFKLAPAVPSDLTMDCFDLAREIRELDMRAAPYDLSALGYEPVRIETPEGRAEYVRQQRGFVDRAQVLRARLVEVCDLLLGAAP